MTEISFIIILLYGFNPLDSSNHSNTAANMYSTKSLSFPSPVFVSVPLKLGKSIRPSIYDTLAPTEKTGIKEAAEAIYQTFKTAC